MSYNSKEVSRQKGEPINCYFFRFGENAPDYYAYTDAEQIIGFEFFDEAGFVNFQPIPITRTSLTSSGSLDKSELSIRTPFDSDIGILFRHHPPSTVVSVSIFQGHVADEDFVSSWIGRVINNNLEGNEVVLSCEPASTSLKRNGLRRNYQFGCPHVLYGPQCKANKPAATVSAGVAGVNGALVSVPGLANAAKYVGGIAEWVRADGRTETRGITKLADSSTLILSGVALGLEAGHPISLSLGCDHKWDSDCTNLHNNVLNFGGQPFIPTKNPIGIVNNFY